MKRKVTMFFCLALFLCTGFNAWAQVPMGFNYQAVARSSAGSLLQNQTLGIKLSIRQGSASGTVVYSERHVPLTNQFGLFTVAVGQGTLLSGNFTTINWATGNYWMQVEMDPAGGTSYTDMGTSQLLTVPYAMYAEKSGSGGTAGPTGPTGPTGLQGPAGPAGANGTNGTNGTNGVTGSTGLTGPTGPLVAGTSGQTLRHNGTAWTANSILYNNGTNIGIGTTSPNSKLHIASETNYTALGVYNHSNFFNGGSSLELNFSRGTQAAPTSVLNGDAIGWLNFRGYTGSAFSTGAWLMARASENWSATALGTDLFFVNVPNGSTTHSNRMTILNSGEVGIGTITPSQKLSVAGNIYLNNGSSTQLYMPGNTSFIRMGSEAAGYPGEINFYGSTGTIEFETKNQSRVCIDSLGKVGIGNNSPVYQLHVSTASGNRHTGYFSNNYSCGLLNTTTGVPLTTSSICVIGEYLGTGNNDGIGVYGKATATNPMYGYGGYFESHYIGVYGRGVAGGHAGVYAFANGATNAIYINGNLAGTGTNSYTSDAKLKKNIQPVVGALDKIMTMNPSVYEFRVGEFGIMELPEGIHYGLIAQDLQKIYPELVIENNLTGEGRPDNVNYLGINYQELTPILISAIQEQQDLIKAQSEMIKNLEQRIENLENKNQ